MRKIAQDVRLLLLLGSGGVLINRGLTARDCNRERFRIVSVPSLNKISLHNVIMRNLVDLGYAPTNEILSNYFGVAPDEMARALSALQDYHGVVLHPHCSEVWVIHPFSTAPTNFAVRLGERMWWGNCAWCSLGIAALLGGNGISIDSTLGAEGIPVKVHIDGGRVQQNLLVHFPTPMTRAWDNVIYFDSLVLLFESEAQIDAWSKRHSIARGDVQPIQRVYDLAAVWYGHHLDQDWHKWTMAEAREIFTRFGLSGPTWDLPSSAERF
jgi:hypothetical protein